MYVISSCCSWLLVKLVLFFFFLDIGPPLELSTDSLGEVGSGDEQQLELSDSLCSSLSTHALGTVTIVVCLLSRKAG